MTAGPARVLKMTDTLGSFSSSAADVALINPNQEWVVEKDAFKGRSRIPPSSVVTLKGVLRQ